jgi:Nitrate/nitrite transporter
MQKNSRMAYTTLIMSTLAFMIVFADWSLFSPLAPQFQKIYHISDLGISMITAVPVILGSLARIPVGLFADHLGGKRVTTGLLLFTLIPLIGATTAHSLLAFICWGFLLGLAGSTFASAVPLVSRWFTSDRQGLALGILGVGGLGTAIASRFAPGLFASIGSWQPIFFIFAGITLLLAIAFHLLVKEGPEPEGQPKTLKQQIGLIATDKKAWAFGLFYFLSFGCLVSFSLYLPKLLVDQYHIGVIDAGNRAAVFVIIANLLRPVGGWLADKYSGAKVLGAVFLCIPIFATILAFSPGTLPLTICFLLIATCSGLGNGAVFQIIPLHFKKDAGSVAGLVGAAGGLGGFFPQIFMGVVKTYFGSYIGGYALLAIVGIICLCIEIGVLGNPLKKVSSPLDIEPA